MENDGNVVGEKVDVRREDGIVVTRQMLKDEVWKNLIEQNEAFLKNQAEYLETLTDNQLKGLIAKNAAEKFLAAANDEAKVLKNNAQERA